MALSMQEKLLGSRFFHLFELKNFRRSVFCTYDRFYSSLFL